LIKQLWVKFDGIDIDCYCDINRKKCTKEQKPECKEYIVKFIQVDRSTEEFKEELKGLLVACKKHKTELERSLKRFKVR